MMVKHVARPPRPYEVTDLFAVFNRQGSGQVAEGSGHVAEGRGLVGEGRGLVTASDLHRVLQGLGQQGTLREYEEVLAGAALRDAGGMDLEEMRDILKAEDDEMTLGTRQQRVSKIHWNENSMKG